MCSCGRALAALEISVGGADHAKIVEAVVAYVAAKTAGRLQPFEASFLKNAIQALGLCGAFDGRGTGHTQRLQACLDLAPAHHFGRRAQVGQAPVGA